MFEYIIFLGHHLYSLSVHGNCKNPVNSRNQCKKAAKSINSGNSVTKFAKFAKATGRGHDLPYGCIFYNPYGISLPNVQHYIFWNPKGAALSFDNKIQQVCYELETSFSGNIVISLLICSVSLN